MRRFILLILTCLLLTTTGHAQTFDPYREALRRIEAARASGAIELVLAGLDLTELPPELWSLSALGILDISHNKLTALPPDIGNLSALYRLNIAENELTVLPPEIERLSNLVWLKVSNNKLTVLPPEIRNLSALRSLHIDHNQFMILPHVGRLPNLTYMAAWGNPLVYPPQSTLDSRGPDGPLFYLRRFPVPIAHPPYRPGASLAWVIGAWTVLSVVAVRGVGWYLRRMG